MKKYIPVLLFIIMIFGCNINGDRTITISINETKTDDKSGITIHLTSINFGKLAAALGFFLSSEDRVNSANNAYNFTESLGLNFIPVVTLDYPSGNNLTFKMKDKGERYYYKGQDGHNYYIYISSIEGKEDFLEVEFTIVETDQVKPEVTTQDKINNIKETLNDISENGQGSDSYETEQVPLTEADVPSSYNQEPVSPTEEETLTEDETFNSDISGLYFFVRSADVEQQEVIGDIKFPEEDNVSSNTVLKPATDYTYYFQNSKYNFRIMRIYSYGIVDFRITKIQ